jgi:hypothetical protein
MSQGMRQRMTKGMRQRMTKGMRQRMTKGTRQRMTKGMRQRMTKGTLGGELRQSLSLIAMTALTAATFLGLGLITAHLLG